MAGSKKTSESAPKFQEVALGNGDKLLPVMQRDRSTLGVYPEGSLRIPSRYSPETTLRKLVTQSPVPSMHQPWYDEILQNISRKRKPRVSVLEGPPGIGKTTLGQVLADGTGMNCHLIPCGYKITSEFIKETTVNGHRLNDMYSEIAKKLEDGTLSKPSIRLLKKELPEVVKETEHGLSLNWDALPEEKLKRALQIVKRIAENEGIAQTHAQGAGITTKNGELLDTLLHAIKYKEPTIIVLDEFSRRRGDGGAMQNLYEVLAGHRDECIVEGGHGRKYTITNEELREAGVYTLITYNPRTLDEPDVKELPGALADRLSPIPMEKATAHDIQVALERQLIGLPVGMLYQAQEEEWKKNPGAFGKHLGEWMELGMDADEKSRIPEHQRSFASNWSNVIRGTQQVAEFFDIWQQVEDQERTTIRYANGKDEKKDAEVQKEVSRRAENAGDAASETKVGVRLMLKLLEDSMDQRPEPMSAEAARKARGFTEDEYPETRFGDRLVKELNLMVQYRYPDPQSRVRKFLERKMAVLGLMASHREKDFDDTTKEIIATERRDSGGGRKPVPDLLNTQRQIPVSQEAKMWQEVWVKYLKEKYPDEIAADAPAQSVLPDTAVVRALNRLPDGIKSNLAELGMAVHTIPLVDAAMEGENRGLQVGHAALVDMRSFDDENKGVPKEIFDAINQQVEEKISTGKSAAPDWQRFLMTLAKPGAAVAMQPYLFTKGFSAWEQSPNSKEIHVMENNSASGLNFTSIRMGETKDGDPHIVHFLKQGDDILVIGSEKVHDHLKMLLRQQNVTYVDRHQSDAKEVVAEKFSRMLDAGSEKLKQAAVAEGQSEEKIRELLATYNANGAAQVSNAFRHRIGPSDELVKKSAQKLGKSTQNLDEKDEIFKDIPFPELLIDDGKLTKPSLVSVAMLDVDLKDFIAKSRGQTLSK